MMVQSLDSISTLHSLRKLSMSGSKKLTELPDAITHLHELEELVLDDTAVTSLPRLFYKLSRLQRLSLSDLDLVVCPEVVGLLLGLTWLNLVGNLFTQLPESLSGLSRLRELDVRDCLFLWWLPASLSKSRRPWLHMVRCLGFRF
jgi:Leucine-rich repeat (LRR) protein